MKELTIWASTAVAVVALVSACQTYSPRHLSSYPDATMLAGQELVDFFEGNTTYGANEPDDKYSPWMEYYEVGGTAHLKDQQGLDTGTWQADSDRLCVVYVSNPNKRYCYSYYRNGKDIFFTVYADNKIVGTVQRVAPGDPEGLAQQQ